jgi:hypothetical protein
LVDEIIARTKGLRGLKALAVILTMAKQDKQ